MQSYLCKAADGVIRAVTMDYLDIEDWAAAGDASERLHVGPIPLEVRGLSHDEANSLIAEPPRLRVPHQRIRSFLRHVPNLP